MKKIGFCDRYGLTKAVLASRKTVTRRICTEYTTHTPIYACEVDSFLFSPDENIVEFILKDGTIKVSVPRYKINEVVAVAQSYKSIFEETLQYAIPQYHFLDDYIDKKGFSNKLFVKPALMPHQIQITDVRIERLQDITDDDCKKEGIKEKPRFPYKKTLPYYYDGGKHEWDNSYKTPREAFASLINRTGVGHKGLWENNPFVAVYGFKLVK